MQEDDSFHRQDSMTITTEAASKLYDSDEQVTHQSGQKFRLHGNQNNQLFNFHSSFQPKNQLPVQQPQYNRQLSQVLNISQQSYNDQEIQYAFGRSISTLYDQYQQQSQTTQMIFSQDGVICTQNPEYITPKEQFECFEDNNNSDADVSENQQYLMNSQQANRYNNFDYGNKFYNQNYSTQMVQFRSPVKLSPTRKKKPKSSRDRIDKQYSKAQRDSDHKIKDLFKKYSSKDLNGFCLRKSDSSTQNLQNNRDDQIQSPPVFRNPFIASTHTVDEQSKWQQYQLYLRNQTSFSRFRMDFKQKRELGRGSFSRVFEVTHRLDGCDYAVKRSMKPIMYDSKKQRWLQEIQVMSTVGSHPNIVRYYNSWIEPDMQSGGDNLYIQLELCGQSLGSLFRQGNQFSEHHLLTIMYQVANALQILHQKGIVHLDVKPDNIYSTSSNQFKLGDFGMATFKNGNYNVVDGDCRYLSRELLNDDYSNLDKTDIFALGATIYELALGRNLPKSDSEYHNIRKGILYNIPNYSSQFMELLKVVMSEDPQQRPDPSTLMEYINQFAGR